MAGVTPERARKSAEAIRALWRRGQKSLARLARLRRRDAGAFNYGRRQDTFRDEAERMGVDAGTASKMRRAAEEYTAAQIADLCASVQKHRSRFGPSHLLVLLRVEDRKRRDRLTRQAVREGWGTGRLQLAVQAERGGRRPHVGRKPSVPADPVERLLALDAQCEKLCRWCDAALASLPGSLQPSVVQAAAAVRKVQGAVAGELRRQTSDGGGGGRRP